MRLYETSFLIAPTLPEEEAETLIEKMAGIVSEKKGTMINVDNWGKKRLAYPIQKFEDAVYVFFLYKGEIDIPTELERNFKQTESVIRYLTIKMEERDNVRRIKKGASREAEPAHEAPPVEKKPEEKEIVEEKPVEPATEEKPRKETTTEETKVGPKEKTKAEQKEEKEEEKKEEKKEEVETSAKKTEETNDSAPIKKGNETGTKKEAATEKEEAAVKEDKEK